MRTRLKNIRLRDMKLAGGVPSILALLIVLSGLGEDLHPASGLGPAHADAFTIPVEFLDTLEKLPGDLGPLPAVPIPVENPQSPEKVELGKLLFFDKRLSGDESMSCASCHAPDQGFSDGRKRAIGFGGDELGRHSPTILNAAYNTAQFWDGRAGSLEDQAKGPIESPVEMNLDRDELIQRLSRVPEYLERFNQVFGEGPTFDHIAEAIASFERTLVTPDSRFDQYRRGDKHALTLQEKKGLALFVSKASCSQCHNGPNFTDNDYYILDAPGGGPASDDPGRQSVTGKVEDHAAFKTPTLRNIALTAPYMHNGELQTLEDVVQFYDQGGGSSDTKSSKMAPLHLTDEEKVDLIAFLKTLTGDIPQIQKPELPQGM
jgi:cytochrome c peroxidase